MDKDLDGPLHMGGVCKPEWRERLSDCEECERAIDTHDALLERIKFMAHAFHHNNYHDGYFKDCAGQICKDNRELIAKAEGK